MIEMAGMFLDCEKDKEKLATVGENILLKLYGGKEKDNLASLRWIVIYFVYFICLLIVLGCIIFIADWQSLKIWQQKES